MIRRSSSRRITGLGHRFRDALTAETGVSIIAEIKRRSPSRGALHPHADAASLARSYRDGGAVCLSVLTNGPGFGGSPEDLRRASEAVDLPVLRKDFLRTEDDVRKTHEMGADALLLIVRDVGVENLRSLQDLALGLEVDVLTEVRDETELEAAVDAGAYMIAVNQRSEPKATHFTVDYRKAVEMSRHFDQLGGGITWVAASGIGVEDGTSMMDLVEAGYDAALIGEALVLAEDPAEKLRELRRDAIRGGPASGRERVMAGL